MSQLISEPNFFEIIPSVIMGGGVGEESCFTWKTP